MLTDENLEKLSLSPKLIKERWRRLKQPALAQKVRRAYVQDGMKNESDPDAALYGAFLLDEDKARSNHLYAEIEAGRWSNMDFRDQRLPVLATRMKARSFAHLLDLSEASDWHEYVREKLSSEGDWLNMSNFERRLGELEAQETSPERQAVLAELRQYGESLTKKYGLVPSDD